MPTLDLQPNDLMRVKTILKQWAPHSEIWAYGSRVNGNGHDASDLDLVVRNPNFLQKPTEHLMQLKQAFRDSDLPIIVDLMDWAYLPDSFRAEIKKRYVIVQTPNKPVL